MERITLKELKATLPSTCGGDTPTHKALRENAQPIAQSNLGSCKMTVFANGFAVYQNEKHYTVLRMEHVGTVNYDPDINGKPVTISVEDEDWTVGVMLCGEERLEKRYCEMADDRLLPITTDSDDNDEEDLELPFDSGEDVVEDYIRNEEREEAKKAVDKLLSCLTERQREIYTLYHLHGLTQEDIADILGVGQPAIAMSLQNSEKKIKKFLEIQKNH